MINQALHAARRTWMAALAVAATAALLLPATGALAQGAQPWPTRPIKLIVPFGVGGPTDLVARGLGQRMSIILGQPVVVENKTGAGGTIATDMVSKSPPDGYTLVFNTFSYAINATLYPKLPYDPMADLVPVALVADTFLVLITNPKVPGNNLRELTATIKADPGKFNFSSSGPGSTLHLAGEMFVSQIGAKGPVHLPYRSNPQTLLAVIQGEAQFAFVAIDSALQHIKAGTVKAIAVAGTVRDVNLPDVPTLQESGLPGFNVSVWFMIQAPKGTPPALAKRINEAVNKAIESPDIIELSKRFVGLKLFNNSTPESTDAFVRNEITRWAPVIRATGAKPE